MDEMENPSDDAQLDLNLGPAGIQLQDDLEGDTPHSSRSVSPSRSSCNWIPAGPRFRSSWASSEGFSISSIAPLSWLTSARRGFLDQLFKAVAGRLTVAIARAARWGLLGVRLIVVRLILL